MLAIIKTLLDELSSVLLEFSKGNHLPNCFLKNYPLYFSFNKCSTFIVLNWELKSSEKQQFDIRLSFNSLHLKPWWPYLNSFCGQLESHNWKLRYTIKKVLVIDCIHSVDISLNRAVLSDSLLVSLTSELPKKLSMNFPKASILIVPNQLDKKYFTKKRLCLISMIIENLIKANLSNNSLANSDTFDNFSKSFNVSDWQHLFVKYEKILAQRYFLYYIL